MSPGDVPPGYLMTYPLPAPFSDAPSVADHIHFFVVPLAWLTIERVDGSRDSQSYITRLGCAYCDATKDHRGPST